MMERHDQERRRQRPDLRVAVAPTLSRRARATIPSAAALDATNSSAATDTTASTAISALTRLPVAPMTTCCLAAKAMIRSAAATTTAGRIRGSTASRDASRCSACPNTLCDSGYPSDRRSSRLGAAWMSSAPLGGSSKRRTSLRCAASIGSRATRRGSSSPWRSIRLVRRPKPCKRSPVGSANLGGLSADAGIQHSHRDGSPAPTGCWL